MVQSVNSNGPTAWTTARPSNPFPRAPGITMGSTYNAPAPARTANPLQQFAQFVDRGTHLSEKVASARTKFAEWKQERAENARQETCRRLDNADAKACGGASRQPALGSTKEVINGFGGTKEAIGNNLTRWMGDIDAHAKASNIDAAAARTELLQATLVKASAAELAKFDTDALKSVAATFERQGRTEKAALLKDFVGMVEMSRTPQGAGRLFLDEAKHHMRESSGGGETFLRSSENPGTAAVRKLMNANGMEAYGTAVLKAVESIFQRSDVKALATELASRKLTNTTHDIPADLARQVGDLAREVLDEAVTVPVPPGLGSTFATLKAEITARGDDKVESYSRKLFSDQIVLKGISSKLGDKDPLMRMAADLINKTASGTGSPNFQPDMKAEYQRVKPLLAPVLDAFFASNGL